MSYEVLWRETYKVALPPSNRFVRSILSTSDTVSRTIFIVSCSQSLSSVPSSLSLEGRKLLVGLAPHILQTVSGVCRPLKLIEQKTRFAVANSGYFTNYLMERAIKKSQTLETGLQIASDLLTDSVHSRNPILRRPVNRRACIGLYANNKRI